MAHSLWQSLALYPRDSEDIPESSNLAKFDSNSFIIAHCGEICKYNTKQNIWECNIYDHEKLGKELDAEVSYYNLSYNDKNHTIYLTDYAILRRYNITTGIYTTNKIKINQDKNIDSDTSMVFIDGKCHLIGGTYNDSHYEYDPNSESLTKIHSFDNNSIDGGWGSFGMVHIERERKLYCFGGFYGTGYGDFDVRTDDIRIYDISTNKWKLLPEKIPYCMNYHACVVGRDERFVVILGGFLRGDDQDFSDEIYVFDIDMKKVSKCKSIKLPFEGACVAIVMDDEDRNGLLVNGFIKECGIDDIPTELVQFMAHWHSIEFVHVIHPNKANSHYKIGLNTILNDIE